MRYHLRQSEPRIVRSILLNATVHFKDINRISHFSQNSQVLYWITLIYPATEKVWNVEDIGYLWRVRSSSGCRSYILPNYCPATCRNFLLRYILLGDFRGTAVLEACPRFLIDIAVTVVNPGFVMRDHCCVLVSKKIWLFWKTQSLNIKHDAHMQSKLMSA